ARPRGRAHAALGTWTRADRPRRAHDRGVRGQRHDRARARRRSSLLPLADGARAHVNELALAAFAAAPDTHAADREARSAGFDRFAASFDGDAYVRGLDDRGLRWLPRSDPAFPERLRAIHDPPPGLFLRGCAEVELLGRPAVAIVGARSCTDYGAHVARELARAVAAARVVVVSGLARGIDGWAHRGALDAGGNTIAVLGCGIDRDYPRAHAQLAARIADAGLIVSEYPPGVAPAPWRFPARKSKGYTTEPFPLNHAGRRCCG